MLTLCHTLCLMLHLYPLTNPPGTGKVHIISPILQEETEAHWVLNTSSEANTI